MRPAPPLFWLGVLFAGAAWRVLSGSTSQLVGVAALVALVASLLLRLWAARTPKDDGRSLAERRAAIGTALVLGALGILLWTARVLPTVDPPRYLLALLYGWTLPFALGGAWVMASDRAIAHSPRLVARAQVQERFAHATLGVLAVAIVVALQAVAARLDVNVDLAHFKTTKVSAQTQSLAQGLPGPLRIVIFQAPASDLTAELRGYFEELGGFSAVEVRDAAAEPALVRELRVKGNGSVALAMGEGEDQVSRSLDVGEQLDRAKPMLRKLDQEVGKLLRELSRGRRVIYLTGGHAELAVTGRGRDETERTKLLRKLTDYLGFELQTLSSAQGLASAVPDDAAMVLVLGPQAPFFAAEVEVLREYLSGGGRVLIALEPRDGGNPLGLDPLEGAPDEENPDPLDALLSEWGVGRGRAVLVSETNVATTTRTTLDRTQLLTDRFSSHPTTATLSRVRPPAPVYFPRATVLEALAVKEPMVATTVIRSLPSTWLDFDSDLEFDTGLEQRTPHPMAIAVSGPADARLWVVSDSSWLSDQGFELALGNRQLFVDVISWLSGEAIEQGEISNEEDIKIAHSREGEAWWFYGTVLLVPGLLLLAGFLRVRSRAKGAV